MTSSRLPCKGLRTLGNRPVLQYSLERLERGAPQLDVIVATSDQPSDDPLQRFCDERGVACYRGPLDDVARRAVDAADRLGAAWFFRVNGDSPFVPVDLFNGALAARGPQTDIVSNVDPRVLCPGLSVELVRTAALRQLLPTLDVEEREHVTACFYRRAHLRARVTQCPVPDVDVHPGTRLVVDVRDDLDAIEGMVARMDRAQWDYSVTDLIDMAQGTPDEVRT